MGYRGAHARGAGLPCAGHGFKESTAAWRLSASYRSWWSVRREKVPTSAVPISDTTEHEPTGELLRQRFYGILFRRAKVRVGNGAIPKYRNCPQRNRNLHPILQYASNPFVAGLRLTSRLRRKVEFYQEAKRALKVVTLRAPSAIEHRRPGYSLASCVPAELASNSPGNISLTHSQSH
jgi:hypothetical protein